MVNDSLRGSIPGEKPVLNEKFESESLEDTWKINIPDLRKKKAQAKTPDKAEKTDEAASSLLVKEGDTKFKKGLRLFHTKRWEKALDEFLEIESDKISQDEQAELSYYMGLCCTKLERFDEALLYFEQVIGMEGGPIRVYQCRMILAYIYIITGRAKMAAAELNRLQGSGLESVMLYNTLAYAAYVQKDFLGAIEFYEKALDLDQENTTALNSLGYVLADTGLDKYRGLRLCRKAVERNSHNAAYLDSLGWASYKCGKLTDARSWLRKAKDIAPQEKEIIDHYKIVSRGAV
jgi:tetratricopeptide (TPR) repeat protein